MVGKLAILSFNTDTIYDLNNSVLCEVITETILTIRTDEHKIYHKTVTVTIKSCFSFFRRFWRYGIKVSAANKSTFNRPTGLLPSCSKPLFSASSLPADVLWGSFVTYSFLPSGEKWRNGSAGGNEYVTNESQRTSAGRLKCETIDMKMIFYSHANKTRFYKKGFALN